MTERYKPSWVPEADDDKFACRVMRGVNDSPLRNTSSTPPQQTGKRPAKLTVDDYVEGILSGNRMMLSRAITLIESNAAAHFEMAQQVIQKVLPYTGKATRIGITGVPGAGKSTFIECLGTKLCQEGHKVAVLAVDPSSTVTGGSILGDKTRMFTLSRQENAFIRPSLRAGRWAASPVKAVKPYFFVKQPAMTQFSSKPSGLVKARPPCAPWSTFSY